MLCWIKGELMQIPKRQPATRKEQIAAWRENIPNIYNGAYRRTYDKAQTGKSLRSAATALCQDCQCWQGVEVKNCTRVVCPLWLYRPGYKRQRRLTESNLALQRACGAVDTERIESEGCGPPGKGHSANLDALGSDEQEKVLV